MIRGYPVAVAQHLPRVPLLGLGRKNIPWKGRRAGLNDDDRRSIMADMPEALGLMREAAPRGGATWPALRRGRRNGHIDDSDFVPHLPDHDARLRAWPPIQ